MTINVEVISYSNKYLHLVSFLLCCHFDTEARLLTHRKYSMITSVINCLLENQKHYCDHNSTCCLNQLFHKGAVSIKQSVYMFFIFFYFIFYLFFQSTTKINSIFIREQHFSKQKCINTGYFYDICLTYLLKSQLQLILCYKNFLYLSGTQPTPNCLAKL